MSGGGGFCLTFNRDVPPDVGWNRLACGQVPYGAASDEQSYWDLAMLWCGFIERIDATYTIDAFYITMFGHGHGTEDNWLEFSRPYKEAGIEEAVRAYFRGVPVEDVLGQ